MSIYKYYLDDVKKIIKEYGYELISEIFIDSKQKLIFKDSEGYLYNNCLGNLLSGERPSRFGNNNPYTIKNIKLWLKLNDNLLELISEECLNTTQKLIFKDKDGYFYFSNFSNILSGEYSSKFHKSNPYTIQNIKLWLELNDMLEYKLITNEYKNNSEYLIFEDKDGYFYVSGLNNVLQGHKPHRFDKNNRFTIYNIKLFLEINNKNLKLISDKYIGYHNKIVLKDKDEFLYFIGLDGLIQGYIPKKFHKSNPYTIQNIKLWCKLNDKPFELVSKIYEDNSKYLKWKCLKDDCGEIFEANWGNISQGKGCPFCSGHQVSLSNCLVTRNPELSKEWHPTKNGDLTPYDVTVRSGIEVWWKCKNNHEYPSIIASRTQGMGCPYCSGRYATKENNLLVCNPKLASEWNYEKNDKRPEDYTPVSGKKVWWKCKECSHEWKINISNRSNGNGCPECSESKGEIRIREYLRENNINYTPQKTFEGLVGTGNGLLSYDFYLSEYNILIEYQGEQHERFCRGVHKTKKDFEKQQEHDSRKRKYAQNNNIRLLEIWYYDFDNVKIILEKELLNKESTI